MGDSGRFWLVGLMVAVACGGTSKSNPSGGAGNANTAGADHVAAAGSHTAGGVSSVAGTGSGTAGSAGIHDSTGGSAGNTSHVDGGEGGGAIDAGTAGEGGTAGEAGAVGEGGGAGEPNTPPEIECACAADEACVRVRVTRATDTSRQPWVVWPSQADGAGTLRLSAVDASYKFQDKASVTNTSFVAATASYGVPLCVPAGSTQIRAFLDDNDDEDPNAVASSDYLDSCAKGSGACFRCYDLTVAAAAKVDVSIELSNSCD